MRRLVIAIAGIVVMVIFATGCATYSVSKAKIFSSDCVTTIDGELNWIVAVSVTAETESEARALSYIKARDKMHAFLGEEILYPLEKIDSYQTKGGGYGAVCIITAPVVLNP